MRIIDVRTNGEFREGHITGALHHDIMDIMQGIFPEVPKNEELILYCESGNRSMMACTMLADAGFSNITNGGGIASMVASGYTME